MSPMELSLGPVGPIVLGTPVLADHSKSAHDNQAGVGTGHTGPFKQNVDDQPTAEKAVEIDANPLPPLDMSCFRFPRSESDAPPEFPLHRIPVRAARLAARIGSDRWNVAAIAGRLDRITADIFVFAVIDSVIER